MRIGFQNKHRAPLLATLAVATLTVHHADALSGIKEHLNIGRRAGLKATSFQQTARSKLMVHSSKSGGGGGVDANRAPRPEERDNASLGGSLKASANDSQIQFSRRDRQSRTNIVLKTLVGSLTALVFFAKAGVLPGEVDVLSSQVGIYTDGMILRDLVSTLVSAGLAYFVVKLITLGYDKGVYSSKVSRKLSHTLLAPFFIIVYPIFSPAEGARYFAAVVTLVNSVRLYLAATGDDESSLARSVSRSGEKSEALGGPFIYVCLLSVFILLFWRSTMTGIVATATMAAGDGMADLVGRKWGRNNKWWFSKDKSVAGTAAFAVFATLTSFGLVSWLQFTGCLQIGIDPIDLLGRIAVIGVICSIVELLPVGDDNFTVPISAAILASYTLK